MNASGLPRCFSHAFASTSSRPSPIVGQVPRAQQHPAVSRKNRLRPFRQDLWLQGCRAAPKTYSDSPLPQEQQQQQHHHHHHHIQEQPAHSASRSEGRPSHLDPFPPTKRSSASDMTYASESDDDQPDALASILDEGEEGGPPSPLWASLTVLGLGVLVGGGYFFRDEIKDFLQYFIQSLQDMGPAGYVAYAVVYTGLELLALPAIPLTMTAGLVFGGISGTIVVSVAATAAATIAFLIARYWARDKVRKIAYKNQKFAAIDKAIGRDSLKFVTLLRLSPLLPLAASNYLYGLTSVELGPYVLGSWLGMLPGTYAYVNAGVAGRAVVMDGGEAMSLDPLQIGLALVTSAVAVAFIGQTAKNAIEEMEREDEVERQKEQS